MTTVRDRWEVIGHLPDALMADGGLVPICVPPAPRHVPPLLREGLQRRRTVVATGVCPCGGRLQTPDLTLGQIDYTAVADDHHTGCPATLPEVYRYLRDLDPPAGFGWVHRRPR